MKLAVDCKPVRQPIAFDEFAGTQFDGACAQAMRSADPRTSLRGAADVMGTLDRTTRRFAAGSRPARRAPALPGLDVDRR